MLIKDTNEYFNFLKKHYKYLNLCKRIIYHNTLVKSFKDISKYDFTELQLKLLYNILNYSKKNIPYYTKVFSDFSFENDNFIHEYNKLPVLTKSIIRTENERLYPTTFDHTKYKNWMNTGGSTGEPLIFPAMNSLEDIHQYSLYNLMGKNFRDSIVSIDGSRVDEQELSRNIYWKNDISNFIYGNIHFSVLYMSDQTLPFYIEHLNKIRPAIIRGYPSGLLKIANFLSDNNIKLKFKIKGIYLTSEYFNGSVIDFLSKTFQCKIYGQYGHAESSVFAFTKANSLEYYCSPIYGYTEVLNKNNEHVNLNEIGEIVVTGFYNKIMPFIRYRTGDMAIYGGSINGFVILKSLQGRTADYLINSRNEKIFVVGLIFGGHLKCFENIKSWQFEQNVPGDVNIFIVKDSNYSVIDEEEISSVLKSVNIKPYFYYTNTLTLTPRGKQKFIIQNIDNQ